MTGGSRTVLRSWREGDSAINEVPRTVREAALAAFDLRRPGVDVLNLVEDTRTPEGDRFVLRFASRQAGVLATVTPQEGGLRVEVAVRPDEPGLVLSLEQLADNNLRVVSQKPVPAVFEGVRGGFVTITGTVEEESTPRWVTAWVKL